MQSAASKLRHEVRVRVANPRDREATLVLEPWGETYFMPAGTTLDVIGEGPADDTFEITSDEAAIVVWGWPGSVVTLLHDNVEVGDRRARPAVPGG